MTEAHSEPALGPPPSAEVVSIEYAAALIDDVRTTIATLERQLEAALQLSSNSGPVVPSPVAAEHAPLADDLLRLADEYRAEAEAHAARVLADARTRAAAVLAAAEGPAT